MFNIINKLLTFVGMDSAIKIEVHRLADKIPEANKCKILNVLYTQKNASLGKVTPYKNKQIYFDKHLDFPS